MYRDTSSGTVNFICFCGVREEGGAGDARISGAVLNAGEDEEMYQRLIRNAPNDRVNQLVARDCTECGLDYMTQIRVGSREIVIWVCKCGHSSSSATRAAEG